MKFDPVAELIARLGELLFAATLLLVRCLVKQTGMSAWPVAGQSRGYLSMGFECMLERALVCPYYSGYIAAGLRTALLELGQVPTCQCMSSEMKLHVHLIQGSRRAIVITEHVKKCFNKVMATKYKCTQGVCKMRRC